MTEFSAILFDLDGTLVDSKAQDEELIRSLLEDILGQKAGRKELDHFYGMTSRKILEEVAPDKIEEYMPVLAEIQHKTMGLSEIFPGILSIVNTLGEAGYAIAVVTSKTREELMITRQFNPLPDHITVWVGADDVLTPKPHPAPLLLALEQLGHAPENAIMIGDTYFDMQAGRAAGVKIGAALWSAVDRPRLLSYDPDFLFETPQEMEELLKWKKN